MELPGERKQGEKYIVQNEVNHCGRNKGMITSPDLEKIIHAT
jgi:hypothetical protein